jgi:hypothetical protein
MKKPTISVEIPEYLQAAVNKLVRYYSEGWRAGYLEGFTKMGAAIIRPIGAIGGTKPQTYNIEQENIQLIAGDVKVHNEVLTFAPESEPEPEKPKRKKREKVEAMREVLVKEFVVDNPPIECLVKKTKRGCRL